jgi:PBSX family phage terminase large subunit
MNVLKEYHRLYTDDFFIADCLGGRAGARSYSITQRALYLLLHEPDFRGFVLRQSHATIYTSIWGDLKDRLKEYQKMHGIDLSKTITLSDNKLGENYAVNHITGGTITTKGFQTSSGQNTGSLKSLAGATHVFIDEADEVSAHSFLKLKMSLRKKGVKIQIYRAFNPPQKDHWLWNDYVLKPMTNDDLFNEIIKVTNDTDIAAIMQLCDNNQHEFFKPLKTKSDAHICIVTNYYNNYEHLNEMAIQDYDSLKYRNFYDYCVQVLGLIPKAGEGTIYKDYEIEPFPEDNFALHGFGLDFGSNDPDALTEVKIDRKAKRIYIRLVYCKNDTSFDGLKDVLQDRVGKIKRIVGDSADRRLIRSYNQIGFNIRGANKKMAVKSQIKHLQGYTLVVDENSRDWLFKRDKKDLNYNLLNCFDNYAWHDTKAGIPNHDYSDPMDSWRYIAIDLLGIR